MDEKKVIGQVFVDTGTLAVLDPCRAVEQENWDAGNQWFDACMASRPACQLGKGDAVLFETGWGDGWYDVVATFREFGPDHKRIAKVEITFIDDDDQPTGVIFTEDAKE